ncbi:MAG: hypothetical protein QXF15_03300 [Candidatus Aenigmatarchaeota archaeon]
MIKFRFPIQIIMKKDILQDCYKLSFKLVSPLYFCYNAKIVTVGIMNKTENNYYVLFLDYDNVEKYVVENDIDFLQKNYNLGSCVLLKSSNSIYKPDGKEVGNYHVFFFTECKLEEIKEMLKNTCCDDKFKSGYIYEHRAWVLRIYKKISLKNKKTIKYIPRLYEIFYDKTNRVADRGFLMFFKKYYRLNLFGLFKKINNTKKVFLQDYLTR